MPYKCKKCKEVHATKPEFGKACKCGAFRPFDFESTTEPVSSAVSGGSTSPSSGPNPSGTKPARGGRKTGQRTSKAAPPNRKAPATPDSDPRPVSEPTKRVGLAFNKSSRTRNLRLPSHSPSKLPGGTAATSKATAPDATNSSPTVSSASTSPTSPAEDSASTTSTPAVEDRATREFNESLEGINLGASKDSLKSIYAESPRQAKALADVLTKSKDVTTELESARANLSSRSARKVSAQSAAEAAELACAQANADPDNFVDGDTNKKILKPEKSEAYSALFTTRDAKDRELRDAERAETEAKSSVSNLEATAEVRDKILADIRFGALSKPIPTGLTEENMVEIVKAYEKNPDLARSALEIAAEGKNPAVVVKGLQVLQPLQSSGFGGETGRYDDKTAKKIARNALEMGCLLGNDYFDRMEAYYASGEHDKEDPLNKSGPSWVARKGIAYTQSLASELVGSDGTVNFSSPQAKAVVDNMHFHPSCLQNPMYQLASQYEDIRKKFTDPERDNPYVTELNQVRLPANDASKGLVSASLGFPAEVERAQAVVAKASEVKDAANSEFEAARDALLRAQESKLNETDWKTYEPIQNDWRSKKEIYDSKVADLARAEEALRQAQAKKNNPTATDAKAAVMTALLTPFAQGQVGSCFATCNCLDFIEQRPQEMMADLTAIVNSGRLAKGGPPVPVITNIAANENNLLRSWEYTIATLGARAENSDKKQGLKTALGNAFVEIHNATVPTEETLTREDRIRREQLEAMQPEYFRQSKSAYDRALKAHNDLVPKFKKDGKKYREQMDAAERDYERANAAHERSKVLWAEQKELLKNTMVTAFTFDYSPTMARSGASADGSSTMGGWIVRQTSDNSIIENQAQFKRSLSDAFTRALPQADPRDISRLAESDLFIAEINKYFAGKGAAWKQESGGQAEYSKQVLFGSETETSDIVAPTGESSSAEKATALMTGMLTKLGDSESRTVTMGIEGIHSERALPNHPSLARLKSGGDIKNNIKTELLDKGDSIAKTEMPEAKADYLYERMLNDIVADFDEETLAAIRDKRPSGNMTPEKLKEHIVKQLIDHKAKGFVKTEEMTESSFREAVARQSGIGPVKDKIDNLLIAQLDYPQFVVADTNWGSVKDRSYHVIAPDPISGQPALWIKTQPPGTLTKAPDKYLNKKWDFTKLAT